MYIVVNVCKWFVCMYIVCMYICIYLSIYVCDRSSIGSSSLPQSGMHPARPIGTCPTRPVSPSALRENVAARPSTAAPAASSSCAPGGRKCSGTSMAPWLGFWGAVGCGCNGGVSPPKKWPCFMLSEHGVLKASSLAVNCFQARRKTNHQTCYEPGVEVLGVWSNPLKWST